MEAIAKVMTETHPEFGIQYELQITLIIALVCVIIGLVIVAGEVLSRIIGAVFSRLLGACLA